MRIVPYLTRAAVVLACCGILIPQAAVAGGPASPVSRDVALTPSGSLTGALLTPAGQPLEGAVISLRRDQQEIARAVSNSQGAFEVSGLSSGVYELAVGQQSVQFRAWAAHIAPASALNQAVLVVGDAARGQEYCPPPGGACMGLDFITLTTLTAAIGAVVISAITLSKVNDLDNKVDTLLSP